MNANVTVKARAEAQVIGSGKEPFRALTMSRRPRGATQVRCLNVPATQLTDIPTTMTRPLCRSYLLILIQTLSAPSNEKGRACDRTMAWALGVVADGKYESLGAWLSESDDADTRVAILADLRLRGVEKIRYVVGPGGSDAAPPFPRCTVLASHEVADDLQRLASRAVRRHRPFESTADAVSFVAGALRRAEERLGDITVEQAVSQLAGRVGRRPPERSGAIPWLAR